MQLRNKMYTIIILSLASSVSYTADADRKHRDQVMQQTMREQDARNRAALEAQKRANEAAAQRARDENWRRIQAQYAAERAKAQKK